jgi:hypothetical protein
MASEAKAEAATSKPNAPQHHHDPQVLFEERGLPTH